MTYTLPAIFAYLDEIKTLLEAADWAAELEPQTYAVGPLNPGMLSFPALGVMATSGQEMDGDTGGSDAKDAVEVSYVLPLSLEDPGETFRMLLAACAFIRGELAAYDPAIDGSWGISNITGWRVRFTPDEFEEGEPVSWLQEITISMEVDKYVPEIES